MINYEIGCLIFIENKQFEKKGKIISMPIDGVCLGYTKSNGIFKADSLKNLRSDIIWITNLDEEYLNNNFTEYTHIKSESFFKLKINSILYELGLNLNNEVKESLIEITRISENIINLIEKNYSFNPKKIRCTHSIQESIFLNKLTNNFKNKKVLDAENNIQEKFDKINIENNNFLITSLPQNNKEIQFFITKPKYEYSHNLLSTNFPLQNWRYISNEKLKNKSQEYIYDKITSRFNAILLIRVNNIDEKLNKLLNQKYKNKKVWVTDIEFNFLINKASIFVDEMYVCEKSDNIKNISQEYEIKKIFHTKDILEQNLISVGIACHNYLYSFIDFFEDSYLNTWIKTADRIYMLDIALFFTNNDIKVLSYGSGALLVSVLETDIDKIKKIHKLSESLKLNCPLNILNYL